jgi:hypothetical protein
MAHHSTCQYIFDRGVKKGQSCGGLTVEGLIYCRACAQPNISDYVPKVNSPALTADKHRKMLLEALRINIETAIRHSRTGYVVEPIPPIFSNYGDASINPYIVALVKSYRDAGYQVTV